MKHKIPLSLILCLISLFSSHAENEQEKADSLINKATESLYNNPQQASYYASKVIALFPDERQNDLKARALFYYSQAENLLGNFDASIKSLYDALEYVAPSNKALSGEIQALIGVVYCKLSDYITDQIRCGQCGTCYLWSRLCLLGVRLFDTFL